MKSFSTKSRPRLVLPAVLALGATGLAAVGGCAQGHGKYTSEGLSQSQERVSLMKSASEYEVAQQSFLAGDLEKALKHCERSMTINPTVPKTYVLQGRIFIEMNRLDGAEQALLKGEALDGKNIEAQYYLGIVYERFTKREMAFERYRAACEIDPANPQYAVAAAEMLIDLERYDEAESFLTSRNEAFEHNAGARQTLGHIALIKGDYDKALTCFSEARLLAPDDPSVLEDFVQAQIATGRFAEAEANLKSLLSVEKNKERRDLRHMQAKCLIHLDRPVEARELLTALTNDPAGAADVEAWIEYGGLAYMLHDPSRLRVAAQRVGSLAPNRHEGHMLRAMLYIQQDQLDKALASADKAVASRGKDIDPLVLKGVILRRMGRTDDAGASFAAALSEDPGNSTLLSMIEGVEQAPAAAVPTEE